MKRTTNFIPALALLISCETTRACPFCADPEAPNATIGHYNFSILFMIGSLIAVMGLLARAVVGAIKEHSHDPP